MRWKTGIVVTVLAIFSNSALAQVVKKAPARPTVDGRWEGTLKAAPGVELRITLRLTQGKDGALSGKWGSPDQGASDLPLGSISFAKGTLAFDTKAAGATFKGKLNQAGNAIAGEWAQSGQNFPLTFKRVDGAKVASKPIPKELEGIWLGKLKVNAGIELRLALKVQKSKDGELMAVLASPDQGANNIPISSISLKDGMLSFESKGIGAKYNGKKNKDGTAFEGEFVQGGLKLPLVLKKTDAIKEAARPQTPKAPFPYRSEAVAYENAAGGVKLAGTLTIPQGTGPFPAVILISGSGAQDRDETIFEHKPFLVLADFLTRRGVAVLRVDDRGVGGSTGSLRTATSELLAGDVLAGVDFLKKRSEIAAKKIGLVGHSEGGIIAPIAAARSDDIAYLVLMAGTGLPGIEIVSAQAELILKALGTSESLMNAQRKAQKRLFEVLAQEKDEKGASAKLTSAIKELTADLPESERKALSESGDVLSEAAIHQINNPWFRFFLTFDPRQTLRKVRCPVLAINGEKDLQVPCRQNLSEIAKALHEGGNQSIRTVEIPGVNHLFQPCKTGTPSEYASIETTFAPEALKVIGEWISEQTRSN
jgi:pimeloyl-ACP methyl ester carboxylesterase